MPRTLIPRQPNLGVLQIGIKSQDTVMSDSDESTVTYTEVSSPFEGLSDIGSPGVVGPEHEGLPWMLDDPYVQEDEVFPAEEQPLPAATSPTAQSPDYVPKSNPEEDPEEDDDEDPEEDPVDYPADGGDDGDDEDESSKDEEDDDVDIEADNDDEDEEHPAHADSTVVALPAVDQAPYAEETEPFETDESAATPPLHLAYRVTARISIRDETPISLPPREEVERLLAMPTPPSLPLSLWLSPLPQIPSPPLPPILSPLPVSPPLPQISSPPLPVSSPVPVLSPSSPSSPIRPLGYRVAMIRLRAETASTSYSLPLPPPIILSHTRPDAPSSGIPPLYLLSTNRRADRPEVTLPPRKRLGIALGLRYEVGESSSAAAARPAGGLMADYGFVSTMDREIRRDLERDRMTEFQTRVRQDTDEIYTRLDDEQSERQLMAGLLNMLYRDRHAHARTARLIEAKARITVGSDYRATSSRPQEACGDYRDVGGRSQEAEAVHRGTEAAEETSDSDDRHQREGPRGVTAILASRDANMNGVDNHNLGTCARRNERATRECTYPDFMKCQPLNFKGTKRVVELTQWIEKMETMFCISNYSVEYQIKFSTYTLLGNALMWWNSHVRTVGNDIAYAMTWTELKKKMTDKYCPRTEIKKLKVELWELKVKGHEYVNCPIRFDDRIRPANLLPIHMLDFDVILGMDWLASHRATIDCYARTVIFGNVRQPEFVYHGSSPLKSVKLISAMKARTLISHGCQGFLASVMDTSLESPNIENLSVVREFADVFPDELPGLPPAREIEFGIELIPGAEPISKAPYRMAPVELKELKEQLQEMLENGFIRPSVSP
ncbi:putative reverse transcriptase domain-containing protein [Tanacetum coccineum]